MVWKDVQSQHGEVVPQPNQGSSHSNGAESRCQHEASSDREVGGQDRGAQRCDTQITDPVQCGAKPVHEGARKETRGEIAALVEISRHKRESGG